MILCVWGGGGSYERGTPAREVRGAGLMNSHGVAKENGAEPLMRVSRTWLVPRS